MLHTVFRKVYYSLSPKSRVVARKIVYSPLDLFNKTFRPSSQLQPDLGDIYTGSGGDFLDLGQEQLGLLIKYGKLTPSDSVLDIGSGIGRTAIPLSSYLNEDGSYEGFDVVEKGVKWCKENISVKHPNFSFTFIPLLNDLYNSHETTAENFEFPYAKHQFDLIFLFSVFSHFQVEEIDQYLNQMARVLKEGGRCLFTGFTYTRDIERQVATQSEFNFPHKLEHSRLMDKKVTGANVAIDHQKLVEMVDRHGLVVDRFIPGYWLQTRVKTGENSFQDVFVLRYG